MSKFTLFTLFLSAIIVVIVAEIMVNEYIKAPYNLDAEANIFSASPAQGTQPLSGAAGTSALLQTQQSQLVSPQNINLPSLLAKAGLQNLELKAEPFSGMLFDRIPLKDLSFLSASEYHLIKNGTIKEAVIYSFPASSDELAREIYGLLKDKCSTEIGIIINENNQFGDTSFYVNYFEYPERVFLVVKKHDTVYALTYGKELHGSIQQLLSLLP